MQKTYPIYDQNGRNELKLIPYLWPTQPKNHTLWGRTYLYSRYKGVPPPPGRISHWKKVRWRNVISPLVFDCYLHVVWGLLLRVSYGIIFAQRISCLKYTIDRFCSSVFLVFPFLVRGSTRQRLVDPRLLWSTLLDHKCKKTSWSKCHGHRIFGGHSQQMDNKTYLDSSNKLLENA